MRRLPPSLTHRPLHVHASFFGSRTANLRTVVHVNVDKMFTHALHETRVLFHVLAILLE